MRPWKRLSAAEVSNVQGLYFLSDEERLALQTTLDQIKQNDPYSTEMTITLVKPLRVEEWMTAVEQQVGLFSQALRRNCFIRTLTIVVVDSSQQWTGSWQLADFMLAGNHSVVRVIFQQVDGVKLEADDADVFFSPLFQYRLQQNETENDFEIFFRGVLQRLHHEIYQQISLGTSEIASVFSDRVTVEMLHTRYDDAINELTPSLMADTRIAELQAESREIEGLLEKRQKGFRGITKDRILQCLQPHLSANEYRFLGERFDFLLAELTYYRQGQIWFSPNQPLICGSIVPTGKHGIYPLLLVAKAGQFDLMRLLLAQGADPLLLINGKRRRSVASVMLDIPDAAIKYQAITVVLEHIRSNTFFEFQPHAGPEKNAMQASLFRMKQLLDAEVPGMVQAIKNLIASNRFDDLGRRVDYKVKSLLDAYALLHAMIVTKPEHYIHYTALLSITMLANPVLAKRIFPLVNELRKIIPREQQQWLLKVPFSLGYAGKSYGALFCRLPRQQVSAEYPLAQEMLVRPPCG